MKLYSLSVSAIIFLFFFACSGGGTDADTSRDAAFQSEALRVEGAEQANKVETEQKRIKNGNIDFETKSIEKSQQQVSELVSRFNGYISDQDQHNYTDRIEYSLQARIPADTFDDFFQSIIDIAHRVENQHISVEDVTQEFIDVESRISTKKELEERYMELLTKASTVEDMIQIERELGTLRSDIESMQGRLNYLKDQTRFSTVTISFFETHTKDFGFFSKFSQAITDVWQGFLRFLVA